MSDKNQRREDTGTDYSIFQEFGADYSDTDEGNILLLASAPPTFLPFIHAKGLSGSVSKKLCANLKNSALNPLCKSRSAPEAGADYSVRTDDGPHYSPGPPPPSFLSSIPAELSNGKAKHRILLIKLLIHAREREQPQ